MSNIQDLKHYGIDAEEKLVRMLSEHLAKEIDKEIIKSIMGMSLSRKQKINKIFQKISDLDFLNNCRSHC